MIIQLEKKTCLSIFLNKTFEEIKLNNLEIKEDCVVMSKNDDGEERFVCSFYKSIVPTTNLKNFVVGTIDTKKFGTYNKKLNDLTNDSYELIKEKAKEVHQKYMKKTDFLYFDEVHFFYNKDIYIHQDDNNSKIQTLTILKHNDVIGLLYFPEFGMYFDLQEGDLLIFDKVFYHCVKRNIEISEKYYRFAIKLLIQLMILYLYCQ